MAFAAALAVAPQLRHFLSSRERPCHLQVQATDDRAPAGRRPKRRPKRRPRRRPRSGSRMQANQNTNVGSRL